MLAKATCFCTKPPTLNKNAKGRCKGMHFTAHNQRYITQETTKQHSYIKEYEKIKLMTYKLNNP